MSWLQSASSARRSIGTERAYGSCCKLQPQLFAHESRSSAGGPWTGDVLSHRRRHEAEEGIQHITARCLGALFESLIPPVPHLTAAYGKRVSEISEQLSPVSLPAGMFADRAGADGTSI
jgi:hypothetical protein